MESSAVSSRFLFRDHDEEDIAADSNYSSVVSSISSDGEENEDSELESMTGIGIRRLCTELEEIKAISDEDFHANVFANYTAFIGILEEVNNMEKELMELKSHVLTHKKLVQDVVPGVYSKAFSDEPMELMREEFVNDESPPANELEEQISYVSETLDILLSENRAGEAIAIIEKEEEKLQKVQLEDDYPLDLLMLYNSVIAEGKAAIMLKLTLLADNCRISAAELQKVLSGICSLGDDQLATQLLIKYYHSRLATGVDVMQNSKLFFDRLHIMKFSKFVFSTISQAARSFVMLYGETSSYDSEFMQWVEEEIESFSDGFVKYVKSISDISGRLPATVEAVQFAVSYCSLLETQRLVLKPFLIMHLQAHVGDVLQMHIDHLKKVINIFTATDAWVLARYLVFGISNEGCSYEVVGQQPEYCLLTNSGRKFITLLQAFTKDVTPLAALEMEGSILAGLSNLFMEYIAILEKALTSEMKATVENGPQIILAETMQQQVSILANAWTLEHYFSSTFLTIFRGNTINSELTEDPSIDNQEHAIDNYVMIIQEASDHLRAQFFRQFLYRVFSLDKSNSISSVCVDSETGSSLVHDPMPSPVFQLLFLELRKLGKLAENNVYEENWLMEILRELIEATFSWISNNKEIWETEKGKLNFQNTGVLNQFVLDINFLVEVIRHEEYFQEQPLAPANLMQSVFISAGLDPLRDGDDDDGWAIKAAADAIERLVDIEKKTESHANNEVTGNNLEPPEIKSENANETFLDTVDSRSLFKVSAATEEEEGKAANATDQEYSVSGEYPNYVETENVAYDKLRFPEEPNLLQTPGEIRTFEDEFV